MLDARLTTTRMLRSVCVIAAALGLTMLVLGLLPGLAIYTDQYGCFARTLGATLSHASPATCEPSYVFARTERVLDAFGWFALLGVLLPGVLVWCRPKLRYGLLWSLIATGFGMLMMVASFELHLLDRVEQLWPAFVFWSLAVGLFGLLLGALPVTCGVFAWRHRKRREPPVELARARVVRHGP